MAAPVLANRMMCAVQKVGTDDAGYNTVGHPESKLTIAAALADLAANYPAASSTNFHIVAVGPGFYSEGPLTIPPWTFIVGTCDGEGQPTVIISLVDGLSSISLTAAWSANATARGGLSNVSIQAASGSPILDFTMPAPVAGNPTRVVELENVHWNLTNLLFQATGTGDTIRDINCRQFGAATDAITLHGGTVLSKTLFSAAAITVDDTGTIASTSQIYGLAITSATGGITFSTTTGHGVTARMGACDNRNLTLNKAGAGTLAVSADAISIPLTANVFYTGTATTANLIRTTDNGGISPSPIPLGTFAQIVRTGNVTSAAWGTAGVAYNDTINTFTDNTSAGAVAGVTAIRSFAIPTVSNATATYADLVNVYIAGAPAVAGGAAATNVWSLYIAAGNARITSGGWYFGTATPGNISGAAGMLTFAAAGTNQGFVFTTTGTGILTSNSMINIQSSSFPGFPSGTGLLFGFDSGSGGRGFFTAYSGGNTGKPLFFDATTHAFGIVGTTKVTIAATTGNLLAAGLTTDGVGAIQLPTATTVAGGITLGNVNIFQNASNALTINATAGLTFRLNNTRVGGVLVQGGSVQMVDLSGASVTVLTT